MEPSSNDFKRDSTPPPAYTSSSAGPSALSQPQVGTQIQPVASLDPYNSVNFNPWAAVPTPSHPNPISGPTPASALQIPYAYYDPRSAHSLAEADARARRRFWFTLLWVLGMWFFLGMFVRWLGEQFPAWFNEGIAW